MYRESAPKKFLNALEIANKESYDCLYSVCFSEEDLEKNENEKIQIKLDLQSLVEKGKNLCDIIKPIEDIGIYKIVNSKTDIVKIITGIVDRKGLQFGSPPVAHVKLRSVAHAQFVVEGLRDGWHFVLAGIDEGLRRSGPGRDGKQQEKKFLHCMTVRFSCKHNYFSRHNKISTADCAL